MSWSLFQTQFTDGEVVLTTHRILWGKPGDIPKGLVCLSLHLFYVYFVEEESGGVFGLGGPKRIIINLSPSLPGIHFTRIIIRVICLLLFNWTLYLLCWLSDCYHCGSCLILHSPYISGKRPGPAVISTYHFIKLSFKDGIDPSFYKTLKEAIAAKAWEKQIPMSSLPMTSLSPSSSPRSSLTPINSKIRSGIVGIERSIEEQHRATDQNINVAFQDLTKLIEKAKEMVAISKNISTKIRVRVFTFYFKSCL